jgi:hypothetical protein
MSPLTPADLDRLEALAKDMTSRAGCWTGDDAFVWAEMLVDLKGNLSAYLAAVNPATVLALVEMARETDTLRRTVGDYEKLHEAALARAECLAAQSDSLGKRAAAFEISAHDWKVVAKKAQAAIPRWIPVGERPPEVDAEVFAWTGTEVEHAALWSDGEWWSIADDRLDGVTHWMPMPAGPKP